MTEKRTANGTIAEMNAALYIERTQSVYRERERADYGME